MENIIDVPQEIKIDCHMIQQSQLLVYIFKGNEIIGIYLK